MHRKDFLRNLALSGLVAGSAIGGFSFWQLGPAGGLRRKKAPQTLASLGSDRSNMIRLASLSPSGHNTQPWSININQPDCWTVKLAADRLLPVVDPVQRESWLSVGAFIETLALAAGEYGYRADFSVSESDAAIAVKLNEAARIAFPPAIIEQRRTLKKNYLSRPLSQPDLARLLGQQSPFCEYYPLDSGEGVFLSDITLEANRLQVQRDDAQAELADWIRWTRREAERYQNGLTPAGMEMPDWLRWLAEYFFDREAVLGSNFRAQTIKMAEEMVKQGAGWLLICGSGASIAKLVATGRALQSIWLRAKAMNIAVHPMTQALEEAKTHELVTARFGCSAPVQFVLRLGYVANYPPPVSPRMPLSAITRT